MPKHLAFVALILFLVNAEEAPSSTNRSDATDGQSADHSESIASLTEARQEALRSHSQSDKYSHRNMEVLDIVDSHVSKRVRPKIRKTVVQDIGKLLSLHFHSNPAREKLVDGQQQPVLQTTFGKPVIRTRQSNLKTGLNKMLHGSKGYINTGMANRSNYKPKSSQNISK